MEKPIHIKVLPCKEGRSFVWYYSTQEKQDEWVGRILQVSLDTEGDFKGKYRYTDSFFFSPEDVQVMKKIGIVVDNWKLSKFRKSLRKSGYEFNESPFTAESTAIFLFVIEEDFEKHKKALFKICKKCEVDLKLSN